MIDKALASGSTTSRHMLAQVMNKTAQFWAVHEGAEVLAGVVISIKTLPMKTVVFVEMIAGRDMDRWAGRVEQLLLEFRDLVGADAITASCRVGLAHRLGKRGWKRNAVVMELQSGR